MTFGTSPIVTAKANGATGGTSSAVNTTGAKLIVIHAGYSGSATISDSKGNTWTAGTEYTGSPNSRFYYCFNPTVGSGHTFTIAGSVSSFVMSAWAVSGNPQLDSQSVPNTLTGTSGRYGSASSTPTANNCLLFAGAAWPSPGFVSGFTAGSGWTVADAQDYVSGTSFGSSQVYKQQTTATAIPSTEQTSTWGTSSGFSYNGIAFKEAAADAVTITTPTTRKFYQRSGTTANIAITGTVAGTTEDLEASFNGGAYQTIATAVAPGSYSGTLTGQAQGQGTLTVRKKTSTTILATVSLIAIGDVFFVGGDSISEGRGDNAQVYTHATLQAGKFTEADVWGDGIDPIDTGTSIGSHWPLLATHIMASQGIPVAFISAGAGGTDMAGSNNTWAKPGAQYATAVQQTVDSGVTAVKAMLCHFGPNAVVNASTLSLATYNTALDTLAGNFATDVAGAPKTFVGIFGEVSTGSPPDRRTALNNIRGAIIQAQADNANVGYGPCLIDLDYTDGVHPKSDTQEQTLAARWWLALSAQIYGGANGRGPRLSSASWNLGRNQLTVVFDRALKTGLTFGLGAWIVSDNGSAMTVSAVAYHGSNPNAVVLTTSAAAVGGAGTTTLTFASGDDAVGLEVPKSTDISMPVGGAVQIPAEPIYAAAVSEFSSTATVTNAGAIASAESVGVPTFTATSNPGLATVTDAGGIASGESVGVPTVSAVVPYTEPTRFDAATLFAIDKAIAASELEIEVDGFRTRYRSVSEMLAARAHIAGVIDAQNAAVNGPGRRTMQFEFQTLRGD